MFERLSHKVTVLWCVVVLSTALLLFAVAIFHHSRYFGFDPSGAISAVSAFAIVVLTVFYVVTTSAQLNVLKLQLDTMVSANRFDSQPLLMVDVYKFEIESPKFYYSPVDQGHSFISRCFASFRAQNIGSAPALGIIYSARIIANDGEKLVECDSDSVTLSALPAGQKYPDQCDDGKRFMFLNDKFDYKTISALRSQGLKSAPFLKISILYTNIMGGCFLVTAYYKLFMREISNLQKLADWHALCASFHVRYRDDLTELGTLRAAGKMKERDEKFTKIRNELLAQVEDAKLEVFCSPLRLKFEVKKLTQKEYEEYALELDSNKFFSLADGLA